MISSTDMIPGNPYMLVVPGQHPEVLGIYGGLVEVAVKKWGGEIEYRSIHYFPERPEMRRKMGLPPIGWSDPTLLWNIPEGSVFVDESEM